MKGAPPASSIRSAKANAVGGSPKRCTKGKNCSATCIAANETCLVELPEQTQTSISKARNYIKSHGLHVGEHVAHGVVAWKAGKVVAPLVSGYLESHYGIPREASAKMAESVIQAATATALNMKHIKSADQFLKNLLVEGAAAFLGKTAHSGVETIMEANEARHVMQIAAPILAGKVTGIATAFAGGKIPTPAELAHLIAERSSQDIQKLINMVRPQAVSFAEEDLTEIAALLADIAVASLILSQGKTKTAI